MPDPQIFIVQNTFEDFEVLSDSARAWDLDFCQLDRGETKADLLQYVSGDLNLGYALFNRHYHQQGSTPVGMRTFAIIEENVVGLSWFGKPVTTSSLLCFPASRELESVSRPGFHVYTLSFSEKLMEQVADQLGLPQLKDILRSEASIRECNATLIHSLRVQLRGLTNDLAKSPEKFLDANLHKIIETEILHSLLSILVDSTVSRDYTSTAWKRSQALTKVKEYVQEAVADLEFISVKDICVHAGVSDRTLQHAFKEYYGVTPQQYLKSLRLHNVLKEIKAGENTTLKISDIANQWGFWHMGQFARDYKQQFDELPSETLGKYKILQ